MLFTPQLSKKNQFNFYESVNKTYTIESVYQYFCPPIVVILQGRKIIILCYSPWNQNYLKCIKMTSLHLIDLKLNRPFKGHRLKNCIDIRK